MVKKNLRKIPPHILERVKGLQVDEVVVGCARTYSMPDIKGGVLEHLGVVVGPEGVLVPSSVVPPANRGKFSRRNREGYVVIRRDLPKEPNVQPHEVPSWGSTSSTHTVYLPHPRFPRDLVAPSLHEVEMVWINRGVDTDKLVLSFRVSEPLSRGQADFESRLLVNLNLLQENVACVGIEHAEMPMADYAKTLNVSWEILPPGTREDAIERVFHGKSATPEDRRAVGDRYDFFHSLGATQLIQGLSGFRRYFGAILPSGIALFENVHYGNAVYIFFSGWERMSQMSRIDLMSGRNGIDFSRVPHREGWQDSVRRVIAEAEKRLG